MLADILETNRNSRKMCNFARKSDIKMLNDIVIDKSWSFTGCSVKDTSYITHSYYTYPAKFIPQLASRLIVEHSQKGDVIIDPFMGSGTTILESIVNERITIGTDINEIAYLVAKVKTTPIKPTELAQEFLNLEIDLEYVQKLYCVFLNTDYHL